MHDRCHRIDDTNDDKRQESPFSLPSFDGSPNEAFSGRNFFYPRISSSSSSVAKIFSILFIVVVFAMPTNANGMRAGQRNLRHREETPPEESMLSLPSSRGLSPETAWSIERISDPHQEDAAKVSLVSDNILNVEFLFRIHQQGEEEEAAAAEEVEAAEAEAAEAEAEAEEPTSQENNELTLWVKIYRYGACENGSDDLVDSYFEGTTRDGATSFEHALHLVIGRSLHHELWEEEEPKDRVSFCLSVALVDGQGGGIILDRYEADVTIGVPSRTVEFVVEQPLSAVSMEHHPIVTISREFIPLDLSYDVRACLCRPVHTSGTVADQNLTYACVTNYSRTLRPGSNFRVCLTAEHDDLEIDRVDEWILEQDAGVREVDEEGVNLMQGGAFRRAVEEGVPDLLTHIEYIDAFLEEEDDEDMALEEAPDELSHDEEETSTEDVIATTPTTTTRKIAVLSTPLNAAFFDAPDLPVSIRGIVRYRRRNRRSLWPETPASWNDEAAAEPPDLTDIFEKETPSPTQPEPLVEPAKPPGGSVHLRLDLNASFAAAAHSTNATESSTAVVAPTKESGWTRSGLVSLVGGGLVLAMLLLHGLLYFCGYRLVSANPKSIENPPEDPSLDGFVDEYPATDAKGRTQKSSRTIQKTPGQKQTNLSLGTEDSFLDEYPETVRKFNSIRRKEGRNQLEIRIRK